MPATRARSPGSPAAGAREAEPARDTSGGNDVGMTGSWSAQIVTAAASGGGGRIRSRRPPAESAAQVGTPVTVSTERPVSMPSVTARHAPAAARRTAPPPTGPRVILAGATGALPAPSGRR